MAEQKNIMSYETVALDDEQSALVILDQTKLPYEVEVLHLTEQKDIWDAIYLLKVRGAPAIGVAGGFGVYLDPASAAAIGMLPQLPAGKLHSIGNASLAGASVLALDASRAADALQTAERCRYIELSGRADFADAFTGGMTYEPVTRR